MRLDYQMRNFIRDNTSLIDSSKFDELYQKAIFDLDNISDLSAVLVNSGIDPLPHIGDMTYPKMFSKLDIANICEQKVLKIPDNIKAITANCFEDTTGFNQVKFTDKLQDVDAYAFSNTQITELDIPGSVKSIGIGAFSLCDRLEKVRLNEGVESLDSRCFSSCGRLYDISLPDSLRAIGSQVIVAWNAERIRIPKNVTYIGERNFIFMYNLFEVSFDMTFDEFKSIIMNALIPEGVKVTFKDKQIMSDGKRIR